jgi:hypothetical protein
MCLGAPYVPRGWLGMYSQKWRGMTQCRCCQPLKESEAVHSLNRSRRHFVTAMAARAHAAKPTGTGTRSDLENADHNNKQADSLTCASNDPPLPSESATSVEVRAFLTDVLCTQYGVEYEASRDVASLWTVGSGRELRTYPAHMFFSVFGDQAGWVLYKEVGSRTTRMNIERNPNFDATKNRECPVPFTKTSKPVGRKANLIIKAP